MSGNRSPDLTEGAIHLRLNSSSRRQSSPTKPRSDAPLFHDAAPAGVGHPSAAGSSTVGGSVRGRRAGSARAGPGQTADHHGRLETGPGRDGGMAAVVSGETAAIAGRRAVKAAADRDFELALCRLFSRRDKSTRMLERCRSPKGEALEIRSNPCSALFPQTRERPRAL